MLRGDIGNARGIRQERFDGESSFFTSPLTPLFQREEPMGLVPGAPNVFPSKKRSDPSPPLKKGAGGISKTGLRLGTRSQATLPIL